MVEYKMPVFTNTIKIILIIHGIFYLLFLLFSQMAGFFVLAFQNTPFANLSLLYRVFTYTLVNSNNILVLLFFGLFMWWVGGRLEESWGTETFVYFYLITISISGLICLIIFNLTGLAPMLMGATGVIFAIIAVFAYLTPNSPFYVFGIFPLKVKWLLAISLVLTFMSPSPRSILYNLLLQVITGLVAVSYVFIRFPLPTWAIPYLGTVKNRIEKIKIDILYRQRKNTFTIYKPPEREHDFAADSGDASEEETARTRRQVDILLDKIRIKGIESLTKKEKKFLDKHSSDYHSFVDDE